eukprot:CAMPEP_0185175474 /NCGR_PEP_ID=MMETSP1139-20130426/26859_1 /TAXON_ID=298111 /ORGANISM="Pavlova sp., Strain CCMP459" /LENGTH=237 /DNA_ID=CAMNT_0027741213 /DNA_START=1 /DNA_END=711 /DNA_ORIENTATION=-
MASSQAAASLAAADTLGTLGGDEGPVPPHGEGAAPGVAADAHKLLSIFSIVNSPVSATQPTDSVHQAKGRSCSGGGGSGEAAARTAATGQRRASGAPAGGATDPSPPSAAAYGSTPSPPPQQPLGLSEALPEPARPTPAASSQRQGSGEDGARAAAAAGAGSRLPAPAVGDVNMRWSSQLTVPPGGWAAHDAAGGSGGGGAVPRSRPPSSGVAVLGISGERSAQAVEDQVPVVSRDG